MGVNRGGKIVTDDLIFCIDAASKRSYSSGTGWADLALGNDGVLVNNAEFSSDGGGCISFDGTNDKVTFATNESVGTSDFTLEIVFRTFSTTGNRGIFIGHPYGTQNASGFILWLGGSTDTKLNFYALPGDGVSQAAIRPTTDELRPQTYFNNWTHYLVTIKRDTASGTLLLLNGEKLDHEYGVSSNVPSSWDLSYPTGEYPRLGDWAYGDFHGQIALARIYKKNFTLAEALQNYNAVRGRFE